MVVLHLQTSCDGCESSVVSNGVGLLAPVLRRLFKNAEGSCTYIHKSHASLFPSSVFSCFSLRDGCTSGSVVRGVDVGTDHVAGERLF